MPHRNRHPRWKKLMQWRRDARHGTAHAGCDGCSWCVPESKPGYWSSQRRSWSNAHVAYRNRETNA